MDRRIGGALLIVLATLSVLVVPRLLNPTRLDGVGAPDAAARPPVVGDCLRDPASADGTRTVVYVPCTELHASEVVYLESLLRVAAPGTAPLSEFRARCVGQRDVPWATRDAGAEADTDWQPAVDINVGVLSPDGARLAAGQRWVACVAGPRSGTFDEPLAVLRTGVLPPEFGVCVFGGGDTEQYTAGVSCNSPHASESFGSRRLAAGSPVTQSALEAGCRDLVRAATLRADLPTDPAFVVAAEAYAWYPYGGSDGLVTLPLPADAGGAYATCEVRTTDGRQLRSSLRRLGAEPLPWAE